MTTRRSLLLALALAGLTACSGTPADNPTPAIATPTESSPAEHISASADPTAAHNEADVAFVTALLRHDQETLDMAKLAPSRAAAPEVKQIAAEVELQQGPQRSELERWLLNRSQPIEVQPDAEQTSVARRLQSLDGKPFDKAFLTAMIRHHHEALELAKRETARGIEPDARALAAQITKDQQSQITRMEELLAQR